MSVGNLILDDVLPLEESVWAKQNARNKSLCCWHWLCGSLSSQLGPIDIQEHYV
jgi:hypothetical protein